jgi:protein SCO1/2
MHSRRQRALRVLAICALAALRVSAQAQTTDQLRREIASVGVVEKLGATVPRGAVLTEPDGSRTSLAALAGRPVLLSFNYTSCPRLCELQLSALARTLDDLGWAGDRFAIVTVSIDPNEQLPQLGRYAEEMVHRAGGGDGVRRAWHFAVASKPDVEALAHAVGFRYRYVPGTGEFAHQATLVVVTGDGRVSGYLHGVTFKPDALREALARAEGGRVATAAEQASLGGFLLTCMGFDPADPAPRALKLMRAGGTLALAFLLSFLGVLAVRDVRRRRGSTGP